MSTMTIQITINGANVTPSETLLAAIKAEYPEWPGSIKEAREMLRPKYYRNHGEAKKCESAYHDVSNVCTAEQANAHAAFGDLLVLMTAINGDYTGWPRWIVYYDFDFSSFCSGERTTTIGTPIWFKSREAAEHAIKIASQEFRLFYGVTPKS